MMKAKCDILEVANTAGQAAREIHYCIVWSGVVTIWEFLATHPSQLKMHF